METIKEARDAARTHARGEYRRKATADQMEIMTKATTDPMETAKMD